MAALAWFAKLVRAKGLEPPHLSILEPKSSASTSSATPAGPPVGGVYSRDGGRGKADGGGLTLGIDQG
jgi:hypothetical protein